MNDSYEVFPKVVSVGQKAKITIRGLRARTISPGWIHNIEICSMTNHSDNTKIRALALPPRDVPVFSEPASGGVIEFHHTFATKGEYRIIVRWDDETTKYVTTESVYAAEPELGDQADDRFGRIGIDGVVEVSQDTACPGGDFRVGTFQGLAQRRLGRFTRLPKKQRCPPPDPEPIVAQFFDRPIDLGRRRRCVGRRERRRGGEQHDGNR